MSQIKNSTVLITGGASGIGKLMGELCLQEGAKRLIIWDIDRKKTEEVTSNLIAKGFDVHMYHVDVSNVENIIMAANAAKDIIEGVNVEVIETKFMTQALECLVHYTEDRTIEENVGAMKEAISEMDNYEITYAIKDTSISGVEIKENDYLVLKNGKIVASTANINEVMENIMNEIVEDDKEVVTVLMGENSDASLIEKFEEELEDKAEFTEVVVHETGQPVYSYLISTI